MKVVLDTDVVVSGLLSPFGSPGQIIRMVTANSLQLCFDTRIIVEYRSVLNRPKFKLDKDHVATLIDQIETYGELIVSEPLKNRLPDNGDEPFLEVEIASQAEYLVTGNIKHYPFNHRNRVKVVTPSEFLIEYKKCDSRQ